MRDVPRSKCSPQEKVVDLKLPLHMMALRIVAFNGHVHTTELYDVDGVKYLVLGGGGAEQDAILPGRTSIKVPEEMVVCDAVVRNLIFLQSSPNQLVARLLSRLDSRTPSGSWHF